MNINEFVSKLNNVTRKEKCSLSDIQQAEEKLNLKFSEEYKELLLSGSFSNDYFEVTSINDECDVVQLTNEVRSIYKNLPKDLYVLIDVGVDGIYILQNQKGKIYEVDDEDEIIQSSGSFVEYLKPLEGK